MIVWLGQPAAVATIGAKSAHLSRLAHHYPVPHGFALPVTAFTQDGPPGRRGEAGADPAPHAQPGGSQCHTDSRGYAPHVATGS